MIRQERISLQAAVVKCGVDSSARSAFEFRAKGIGIYGRRKPNSALLS